MKKSSDSIDRLVVKQLTLESKNGSIILSVGNDGKINFLPYNKNQTGSFSIDLKNEKIITKKVEFIKDNSSFTSSLNIGSGGSSINDGKFDPSTGKLLEGYLPDAFNDIRENAINAIGKFDGTTGKLKNIHINQDIKDAIDLGVSANVDLSNLDFVIDQTNPDIPIIKISRGTKGITSTTITKNAIGLGNVLNESPASIRNGISIDIDGAIQGIGNGVGTKVNNSKITIDSSTGKLVGIGTNDVVVSNSKITVDATNGKLVGIGTNDIVVNNSKITVDTTSGKLVGIGTSDIVVNNEKTFVDTRFTTVQSTANTANNIANTIDNRFTDGLLNVANASAGLRNTNISVDANGALQGIGSGAGTVVNNNSLGINQSADGTITITRGTGLTNLSTNPLSTTTFTSVQSTANTIKNRFGENGRLLEENSLNNSVRYFSPGSSLSNNPQENDQAILAGTDGAIGYNLIYGTKVYDFSDNIPNSSKTFSSILNNIQTDPPENSTISSLYLNSYFKSEFTVSNETNQGLVKYLKNMTSLINHNNKVGFISNNSTESFLTFNNLFYGPIIIKINYNPVQLINGTYWSSDGYNGHSSSPPYFRIQTRQDNSLTWNTPSTVFRDQNNNNSSVGSAITQLDGIKSNNIKIISKTENLSGFNQIRISFDSIVSSKAFIIESIEITGWFRSTDPDVLSKLYQLADNSNFAFTFTGQHKCNFIDNISLIREGLIVVSTGEYDNVSMEENLESRYKPSIDESVPKVKLSKTRNDKSVFGVISKKSNNSKFTNPMFPENGQKQTFSENRYEINSLGEGGIWVCNINGNLENGDYITSCEIPGYGMKQNDDLLHNYTVAKITCDCDFNLSSSVYICEEFEFEGKTYRRAFVGCTYHCG